ncbi:WGR domain-containing protein [Mesorhizobium sp. BHbdii]
MSNSEPAPVHLRRIDPAQNMRRFYSLSIQPTLFGGASLVRDWGRIGTRGQIMVETFDHAAEATHALGRLEKTKRRRGYQDARRR